MAQIRARHDTADGQFVCGLHLARHGLRPRRLQFDLLRFRRRTGHVHGSACHARHPLCLYRGAAPSRCRGGNVGAALADPACDSADAKASPGGGPAMSIMGSIAGNPPRIRSKWFYRLRSYGSEALALAFAGVLVIWSLTPIYNMWTIALADHDAIFSGALWPENPTLHSFYIVFTQGFWYLEQFWLQFGNSFFVGLMVCFLTLLIGSLASFTVGRLRLRSGWLLTNAALMTYVIPASFLAIPMYR